jgi:hypothetical protein
MWGRLRLRAGGQAGRRAGGQAGRRAGGQAGRRAGGQAGRRAGGQAGRRAGGQPRRQLITHLGGAIHQDILFEVTAVLQLPHLLAVRRVRPAVVQRSTAAAASRQPAVGPRRRGGSSRTLCHRNRLVACSSARGLVRHSQLLQASAAAVAAMSSSQTHGPGPTPTCPAAGAHSVGPWGSAGPACQAAVRAGAPAGKAGSAAKPQARQCMHLGATPASCAS